MSASDDAIVQRVRAGDVEAFSHLVSAYRRSVYAMALATTADVGEAEDLVQTCFVEAFSRIGELRSGRRFRSWLYAIARTACSDWLRRHSRTPALFGDPAKLDSADPTALPNSPEAAAIASADRDTINAAINSLPPRYRPVVILRHIADLTYDEISDALGLSVSAAKVRCHRAMKMLKVRLEKRHSEIEEDERHELPAD